MKTWPVLWEGGHFPACLDVNVAPNAFECLCYREFGVIIYSGRYQQVKPELRQGWEVQLQRFLNYSSATSVFESIERLSG